jgi:alpha-tubulin suppressor-like RCC1 family protein
MRRLLAAGIGLMTCAPLIVGTAGPALSASGGTVEHWGVLAGGGGRSLSPVSVSVPGTVAEVGTSNSAQYALLTNGRVYAWGVGTRGELGNGSRHNSLTTAVRVRFPAGVTIAFLATDDMPFDTAFAVDTAGHAWGWGANAGGELCLGNTNVYTSPVELPFSGVTTLAGAANHATYAAGGAVYSCGKNRDGALGTGDMRAAPHPVRVKGLNGHQVTAVVSALGNTGALMSDGTYYDWGYNGGGQLGIGTVGLPSTVPVQVHLPAAATQVVVGGNGPNDDHTLVKLSNGLLYAWGANGAYQLGLGTKVGKSSPTRFSPPAGVTYRMLATGGIASFAIATTGDVYAWGGNKNGQLGDGTTQRSPKPIRITTGGTLISSTSNNAAVAIGG